jgi:hypothetical protein
MKEFETMQSDPNKEGYDNYVNSLYHSSGCGQYITHLTSQGITHAGIFGADGSLLAASPNFPVSFFSSIHINLNIYIFVFSQSITLKMDCRKLFLHHHQAL